MAQFFLWLNVMAVVILASSISSSLQIYLKNRTVWKKYYLFTKAGFLLWLMLYTYDYFSFIYISSPGTIPINRFLAVFALLFYGFLINVYALFLITIAGKKLQCVNILGTAILSSLYIITGFLFIFLEKPVIENYLHISFYIILFLYSLYGVYYWKYLSHDTSKKEGFLFIILTLIFTPLGFFEYMLFHFSSFSNAYFPDGAFTLPTYCVAWGLSIIIRNSLLIYTTHLEEEKPIPGDFIKKHNITDREKEIISFLLKGCNNIDIASTLFISLRTVDTHVYNIYKKCGVKNRIGLLHEVDSHRIVV